MATHTPLRISPVGSDNPHITQSEERGSNCYSGSAELASETLVGGDNANALFTAAATPAAQGSVVPGSGGHFSSPPRTSGSLGLARERMNLTSCGLPQNVIMTIQSARAPSTRTVYEAKWRVFEDWCTSTDEVPFQCSVDTVLIFLQSLLDKGRAFFSTLKVYLAAISACHMGINGKTVGQHPLVCRFVRGARRLRPVSKHLSPGWDLPLVLGGFIGAAHCQKWTRKHFPLRRRCSWR